MNLFSLQYYSNHPAANSDQAAESTLILLEFLQKYSLSAQEGQRRSRARVKSMLADKKKSRKFDEKQIPNQQDLKKGEPNKGILGNGKTSDRIRIAMWNVNGIRSVFNKNAIHNFVKQYIPDILCINQTKINKELFDKSPIQLSGYSGYWNFCKVSAGYSGVAIFSKFLPISIFEDLEEPAYSQEGRVLTLQYESFFLVAVYIPSAGDKKLQRLHYKTQQYEKAFHKYCQKLKAKNKGVIVCGDLNVCHEEIDIHFTPYAYKHPGFTPEERKSFRNFLNLGWIDTFRKLNPTLKQYTWWRIEHGNRQRNIGKRLDYFLVNESFFPVVVKSQILGDVKGSDHCPIYLIMDLRNLKQSQKQQQEKQESVVSAAKEPESATHQLQKKQQGASQAKEIDERTPNGSQNEQMQANGEAKNEQQKVECIAQANNSAELTSNINDCKQTV